MTHDDWRAEHNAFLENVQHEDIRDLYLDALRDNDEARQKLTTIVELAWGTYGIWSHRENEAARAIRLLFVYAGFKVKGRRPL